MKVDLPLFVYFSSSSKGLFIWEATQPGNWDNPVCEISVDSYFPIGNFVSFVWISLESSEISVSGMKSTNE